MSGEIKLENLDARPAATDNLGATQLGPDGVPIGFPAGLPATSSQNTLSEANESPEELVEAKIGTDGLPVASDKPYDKFAEPGRVRRFTTILNLMNSLLGAGILGVPAGMSYCGIVPAVIMLFVLAALSHIATVLTIKLQAKTNADGMDDLAARVLGRWGSIFLSIFSMCFCISCMVAYIVIAIDTLKSWFRLAGVSSISSGYRSLMVLIYALCIPAAMTIPRQVKFLSFSSYIKFTAIIFYVIIIIVKAIILIPKNGLGSGIVLAKMDMGFFNALSVFCLAFALPVVVLPIIAPYNKDPTKRSWASFWGMTLCFTCVAIPGVLGYLILGSSVADNILLSFADNDPLIICCRVGFFLIVSFSYPCVGQSMLCSWSEIIFHTNNQSELPIKKRIVVLLLSNGIPIGIGMIFSNAGPALSIGGALGGCLVDFCWPPVMWIVTSGQKWYHYQNLLCILFTVFGVASAAICTYEAIVTAIKDL